MKILFYSVDAGCCRHTADEVEISIARTAVRRAFSATVGGRRSDRLWLRRDSCRLASHRTVAQHDSQRTTRIGGARQVAERASPHAIASCRWRTKEEDYFRSRIVGSAGVFGRSGDARRSRNSVALDLQEYC